LRLSAGPDETRPRACALALGLGPPLVSGPWLSKPITGEVCSTIETPTPSTPTTEEDLDSSLSGVLLSCCCCCTLTKLPCCFASGPYRSHAPRFCTLPTSREPRVATVLARLGSGATEFRSFKKDRSPGPKQCFFLQLLITRPAFSSTDGYVGICSAGAKLGMMLQFAEFSLSNCCFASLPAGA